MSKVRLVFCIHNHQPVGNLPEVFEDAYRRAYLPFLEAIERHPDVRMVLHNSGPLLEWYEDHAPEYLDRVRALVEAGQVEVLSGGFYEPILSAIPERDALDQIAMMNDYVADRFGARPRGMWLAERVWEPRLAKTIGEAGVEYLPLDDYEFRLAGVEDEDLTGYFVTEDQGVATRVFPISKPLRYAIPFADPEETLKIMGELAERGPDLTAVFGDDGEKFGVWPGTHAHVHAGGWLDRFLDALSDNKDWLTTATFADVVDSTPPAGRVYLPTSSYPEMMQWALPTPARRNYERMLEKLEEDGLTEEWGGYLSGGTWKGFISKYEESNLMVRKMMRVSAKVDRVRRAAAILGELDELPDVVRSSSAGPAAVSAETLALAERELWQGQCNCAYWHGVFGGLYLPHLRSAIYEHLIRAERLLDSGRGETWDAAEVIDHDLDGHDEVLLESGYLNVYVAPWRGGSIFELDVRRAAWNALGTMSRHEEAYHSEIPTDDGETCDDGIRSIHDGLVVKEPGLDELAVADTNPRWAAVDHFYEANAKRKQAEGGRCDVGDCAWGVYDFEPARAEGSIGVAMTRRCRIVWSGGETHVLVEKSVWLERDAVKVKYALTPEADIDVMFASEWNFAFLTGAREWVTMQFPGAEPTDPRRRKSVNGVERFEVRDRIRMETLSLSCAPAAGVWTWPLETASHSEGGLERVFQGLTAVTHWPLRASSGERVEFQVTVRSEPLAAD